MQGIGSILATIMGMGKGLGDIATGFMTARQGKKLFEMPLEKYKEKTGLPEYETPESYEKYRDLMGTMARQEMPGYTQMKKGIESAFGTTVGAGRNLGSAAQAAVLLGAGQDRLKALRRLGIAASQYQAGAQQRYVQAVGQGAQYEDLAYQYNQRNPWGMKMNEAMGMRGAGTQMMQTGWDQFMGGGVEGANLYAQEDWYNRMYPQQGYIPTYTPMRSPIPQLGQQQVAPATSLGYDPYAYGYTPPVNTLPR